MKENTKIRIMASEQVMNERVAKVVAEAMRVAIQAMVAAIGEQMQSMAGTKIGTPTMNNQCPIGRQKTSIIS